MSKRTKAIIVVTLLSLLGGIALSLRHMLSPRVVARAITPDGVELCVVQESGRDFPPFRTSVVFRKPNTNWGWFYYDHEDWYWRTGRISLDTTTRVATIYRDGEPRVTFKWDTERFTLMRPDHFFACSGAQSRLRGDWAPGKRIE